MLSLVTIFLKCDNFFSNMIKCIPFLSATKNN
jgi:hypothetical protein